MSTTKRVSIVFLITVIMLVLQACDASSVEQAGTTATTTVLIAPGMNETPIAEPTPFQGWDPTPLPPIDSTQLPDLLQEAYAIQPLNSVNGHTLKRVTGWSYGYEDHEGKAAPYYTHRYQWMDSRHLLLFPMTGIVRHPNWDTELKRAVVMNLETGKVWLPPEERKEENRVLDILLPRWSPDAGVLISAGENVVTYTPEGEPVGFYQGELIDISPTGNKMLVDDTWVDLKSGKIVDFAWYFGVTTQRWLPAWSSDETRVYMCCYFYGDATTGESYSLTEDGNLFEGKPIDLSPDSFQSLQHAYGAWLNDTYVLARGDGFYTYMTGFEFMLPMFDPSAKTYRDLSKLANLPDSTDSVDGVPWDITISPNGNYLWAHKPTAQNGFLVDLQTLQSEEYPARSIQWSETGEYAVIDSKLLNLSSKEIKALPGNMTRCSWHPTKSICITITTDAENKQLLTLLNAQDMTAQEVILPTQIFFMGNIWSPTGGYIALAAEDNTLWQIDYPALNNLQQLTLPIGNLSIENVMWSPDGTRLSFVDGTDIYIVDAGRNP